MRRSGDRSVPAVRRIRRLSFDSAMPWICAGSLTERHVVNNPHPSKRSFSSLFLTGSLTSQKDPPPLLGRMDIECFPAIP